MTVWKFGQEFSVMASALFAWASWMGFICQSILWRLALFKLGARDIAPILQDLRVERHIT
jgi:hypothetical protein